MRMLIVCPKPEFYNSKDLESLRIIRNNFKKYLSLIIDNGGELYHLIEDELAAQILKEFDISKTQSITITKPSAIEFLKKNMVKEKFTSIVNIWDSAKFVDMHPEEKYPLPLPFKYPNLNDWKEARISNIEDCIKFAANRYIRESEATIMFRGGGNQDTYSSLLKSIYEGDGRLYIEVDLNTGTAMSYYGGVYVDLDTVKMLVGLGG